MEPHGSCRPHLRPAWPLQVRLFGAQQAQHTAGEKDVVGARPGDIKEGAAGPIHTEAASVANLVPSAARIDVAVNLQHMGTKMGQNPPGLGKDYFKCLISGLCAGTAWEKSVVSHTRVPQAPQDPTHTPVAQTEGHSHSWGGPGATNRDKAAQCAGSAGARAQSLGKVP